MHSAPPRSAARPIASALLAFVAGSAVQLAQERLFDGRVYLALFLGATVALMLSGRSRRALPWRPFALLLACAVVGFGQTGWRASVFQRHGLAVELEGQDLRVSGIVDAMPQSGQAGTRFRLQVEDARTAVDGQVVPLPALIYLGWYPGSATAPPLGAADEFAELKRPPQPLRAGERWQMTVRLRAPHGNRNPHGFDYELWLWEQGLQATGYVRSGSQDAAAQPLGQTGRRPVELARQGVRDRIFDRVAERQTAGLIAALVVGDQNAIERADWDLFRATGVAHLMSISGLHVSMFAWLAGALVGMAWRRSAWLCLRWPAPHAALLGGIVLALAYAVFSGWGVPAQRTVWMLATAGLLRLSGRRWPWPAVWSLVCAVVVAVDPWSLTQAGFWLSFVAVGVLFASDLGDTAARATPAAAVVARLRAALREQALITMALTPLTLVLFGQVSVVALVANALAIPWVTLVITPLAMLGVVAAPLWLLAAAAVDALGSFLQWLAQWPFATLAVARSPWWVGASGLLGGMLLAMGLPWTLRLAGLPLLLPLLLWQSPRPAVGEFDLLAADIGQGNAVLVRTAGHALLYDAGPRYSLDSDAGHRVLVPLLRALGVQLDRLLLSHRDSDHTGGALSVLAMQPQAELLSSIEGEHVLQSVRTVQRCQAGQRWSWDGVEFSVLHPQPADYAGHPRPNALSCVLRIASQSGISPRVALLVGDIEAPQEHALVAAGAALRADLLLVPHHGSRSSSSGEFLDAVAPRVALVQAGYRNRFGHPAPAPMQRYRERGIEVIDSPHCGAALWRSVQPQQVHCERTQSARYWQHVAP